VEGLARLTRHEILKEDKFLTTVEGLRDFFLAKSRGLLMGLGGVGVSLLLILGIRYYLAQQNEKATDKLSQALRSYHALVGPAANPANPTDLTFGTAKEKYEKALVEFQTTIASYESHSAGKIAKYYSGLCFWELNRTNEAIAALEPLSKEKSDYGALALRALAAIYESTCDLAKAAEAFQQIVNTDSAVVPKSESLMYLAELYEQQRKSAEATKVYQQVIKDYPGTSHVTEAERKLKQLSQ
jgi:tetratricopeptide (TPR) repeat protein